MAKKLILALIVLIFILFFAFLMINNNTVNVYTDGKNISVETRSLNNIDFNSLNHEICDYTSRVMNDTTTNASGLHDGIENICIRYGMNNPTININSSLGPNQIPVVINVDGTSMLPTLQDGQTVLMNKTHDIHVGDIVVADSEEYGGIIKRVDQINGNDIHLISDNKNISYEYINGVLYEVKGVTTWVDISDIGGVVIDY
ncbi:MAG: S24/S26 family peptidase [Methanobrevibacter sp.]|nr:S24/S26 family peptidase [Methanobrevibacter sp.]